MWERLISGYASVRSDSEKVYRRMKESTATSGEYCLLNASCRVSRKARGERRGVRPCQQGRKENWQTGSISLVGSLGLGSDEWCGR